MTAASTRRRRVIIIAGVLVVVVAAVVGGVLAARQGTAPATVVGADQAHTTTPIKHVVVIFDENISFDHYFGTYPKAANTDGTPFTAAPGTPAVNGLTPALIEHNPNLYGPTRLTPQQALTCDQSHNYDKEQRAYDNGALDKFVQYTEAATCTGQPVLFGKPGLVMGYYDGNTVTALWNYAQHFAMSDNFFAAIYGPSTPGAINLVSGQTHGVRVYDPKTDKPTTDLTYSASPDPAGVGTLIDDADPLGDECSDHNRTTTDTLASFTGRNIGDLLNQHQLSWGWFQSGFAPTGHDPSGEALCAAKHPNVGGNQVFDYVPHHDPFQYYLSTANPKHLPPSSVAAIGSTDQANHNYDLSDFDTALAAGNLPSVSYLKPPAYRNGHAGYSSPLDEQPFLVTEINKIQQSPAWPSTAIFIAYDDSDGWYDHVMPPVVNGSSDPARDSAPCTANTALTGQLDRCGLGPRLPLLAISPYSKANYVDHGLSSQASVLRFIEDNWGLGQLGNGSYDTIAPSLLRADGMFDFTAPPHPAPVLLDPATGAVSH
ncbi:MAG: alkaline phosphatase family protein [Pseudonocardia sp.]|nr:alkaline phosphatase family protein [Pseudonocardia sp.]